MVWLVAICHYAITASGCHELLAERTQPVAAALQPNFAKRLECAELAPALEPPRPDDSASKLLHLTRIFPHRSQSQLR